VALAALWACASASDARAEGESDVEALRRAVEDLVRQNREMQSSLRALQEEVRDAKQEVRDAKQEALAAQDEARAARRGDAPIALASWSPAAPAQVPPGDEGAIFSQQVGRANLQLLDLSLDVLTAVGGSTETGENLQLLQAGEHDPRQRGFTLQQLELGFKGAVDPYFTGEAYLVYFIDPAGESRFELEEAFATTRALPFGAEEFGLQAEAGTFFTEFGRINPVHPHAWDWQDQPFVWSRFFGGDGIRGPGLRLGWLMPLPWFSELHVGVQNCGGETMVSFCANQEVFAERPIGGRPFGDPGVQNLSDFTWLLRWANGLDVSDTISSQVGVSSLFGQNATGWDGWTNIVGGDVVVKWRPLTADRGWPFVTFQAEAMGRWYDAAAFSGCPLEACNAPVFVPGETLEDWGFYAQILWGFARNWAVGIRGEYGTGSGADVAFEDDGMGNVSVVGAPRNQDPFRGDRARVSPLLLFQPTEFSRLRLQYNFDDADFLIGNTAHTVWAGLEFLFGAHPAHGY
jgi:hypothetical protein